MLAVARPACQPCTGGSTSKPGRGKHMLGLALASCQLSTGGSTLTPDRHAHVHAMTGMHVFGLKVHARMT